jgi:hypothetical protein
MDPLFWGGAVIPTYAPLGIGARSLTPSQKRLPPELKEWLALRFAFEEFSYFLRGKRDRRDPAVLDHKRIKASFHAKFAMEAIWAAIERFHAYNFVVSARGASDYLTRSGPGGELLGLGPNPDVRNPGPEGGYYDDSSTERSPPMSSDEETSSSEDEGSAVLNERGLEPLSRPGSPFSFNSWESDEEIEEVSSPSATGAEEGMDFGIRMLPSLRGEFSPEVARRVVGIEIGEYLQLAIILRSGPNPEDIVQGRNPILHHGN